MSLILEALRRSEAERQLGRVPAVLTPMPLLRAARRARRWPWWLALALSLLALTAWIGWQRAHRESQRMSPVASASHTPAAIPGAAIEAAAPPLRPVRSGTTNADVTRVAAARPDSIPHDPTRSSRLAATAPAASSARPTAAAATTAAPNVDAVFSSDTAHPSAAADVADTAPASVDALQSIADLSPAERQSLPALKVSMHVYAELPGDRFMIIDGARVGEGARIGDRIVLVRIRRDGGELDIGGRRLLLPKP